MKLNIEEILVQVPDDLKEAAMFEAFARLIVERCAVECETISVDKWSLYKGRAPYTGKEPGRADPDTQGQSDGADSCAAAIRKLLESE